MSVFKSVLNISGKHLGHGYNVRYFTFTNTVISIAVIGYQNKVAMEMCYKYYLRYNSSAWSSFVGKDSWSKSTKKEKKKDKCSVISLGIHSSPCVTLRPRLVMRLFYLISLFTNVYYQRLDRWNLGRHWKRGSNDRLTGRGHDIFENTNFCEKYHTLSRWGCHLTLGSSDGRGFNCRAEQLSPVTDKWWRFSNLCSIFSIV